MNRTVNQYPASFNSPTFLSLPAHSKVLSVFVQPGGMGPQVAVEQDQNFSGGYETHNVTPVRGFDTIPENSVFIGTLLTPEFGAPIHFYVGR
jgi:hypothetical protein